MAKAMTNEEVMELIEEMAPELVDRAREAENPVEAILQAWVDAREINRECTQREAKLVNEFGDLVLLRMVL